VRAALVGDAVAPFDGDGAHACSARCLDVAQIVAEINALGRIELQLARGGRYRILEGPEKFNRFVVIEFPTLEQGVACFNSQEYKDAAAFRRKNNAGENELVMVEAA